MNKAKLFIENLFVYGLGGIISKVVPLIMVPIVTWIMPDTSYFGISDMSHTLVQFGSAIAVMGMYDAMYRLFFEKEDENYKKTVCSTALLFTMTTSMIVFAIMLVFREGLAKLFFKNVEYSYVVYISAMATLVGATNSIISAPTRMQNKKKIFLITNTVSPILSYSISVPLLLAGHYIIALPLAAVIAGITMEVSFALLNHQWFKLNMFDKKLLKPLLLIAIPLLPNFLIYWVFNSCDKLMITNIIGMGEAGIYSVGSKLGHASQLIYTAFAGGWQFFAFSTMTEKNQVKTNSLIFEYLAAISFSVTAYVCAFSSAIYSVAFPEGYYSGYIIAPYLFFSPLLQMLFQVASNQFIVVKKTWPNLFILAGGAGVNVLLNYKLIPVLGIEGASIATLFGYVLSLVICVIVLSKMKLMIVSKRLLLICMGIIVFFVLWRFLFPDKIIISVMAATAILIYYFILYRTELMNVVTIIKRKFNKQK